MEVNSILLEIKDFFHEGSDKTPLHPRNLTSVNFLFFFFLFLQSTAHLKSV